MKKNMFLGVLTALMLIFALMGLALAEESDTSGLYIDEKDGKYALIAGDGTPLTEYIYDSISSNLADPPYQVKRNGHVGFIDVNGVEIVPAVYDRLWSVFDEGVLPAKIGKKWGFVDDNGRLVIGPWYDEVEGFSEGLAAVDTDGKWGFIDHAGNMVIEQAFESANWFSDGYAAAMQGGKWGLIDKTGKWALEPEFDYMDFSVEDTGLIAVLNSDNTYTYFDISSGEAVEVKSVRSNIDLSAYMPFEGKKVAVLDEKCTLNKRASKEDRLPLLDGATALFPVYSAFCQATYPKDTRYTDPYEVTEEGAQALITCTKTNVAYERLIRREADIIFAAQPSDEELDMAQESGVEFEMTPFGKEAFVFIVNKDNPLENITTEQIKDIYSGKITDWSELGIDGLGPIVAYQRPKNSGSQTALEALMGDTPLMEAPQGVVAWDMGDIVDTIEYRNLPNAIGYSFRFFCTDMLGSEVKLLAVDGVLPTEENIRNGSYPITSTLYAIRLADNANPNVTALLDWIKSPQGMELVEKSGYTPWEY